MAVVSFSYVEPGEFVKKGFVFLVVGVIIIRSSVYS